MSASPSIVLRLHANTHGSVLAAADEELIGKTLTEGKISFHVSKTFYFDQKVNEKEFIEFLSQAGNINLVGENVIRIAQQQKMIPLTGGMRISNVPHVQIYKI